MRFTRFPYHLNLGLRPEALGIPEEHIVIADPRLVDSAVLSEVVVRQDAPLWSNLLQVKDCLNGPPEFAGERESSTAWLLPGALMEKRQLDPSKWRANHYVTLLGRALVFEAEDRRVNKSLAATCMRFW